MPYIYILFFIIVLFITYKMFSTIIDVINLFNLVWCIPAALANTGLLGLYIPSFKTNIIIMLTIISFNIGYLISTKYRFIYNKKNEINLNINIKCIVMIHLIIWFTFIPYTLKATNVLINKGFEYLRSISFTPSSELVGSTFELMYCQTVVAGVFTATIIIMAIQLVLGVINKKVLLIGCIDILLYSFTFAGRVFFFKTIIFLVLAYFIAKRMNFKKYILSNKIKYTIIVAIIIFMIYFTMNRSVGGLGLFENLYIYFVGPFPFLDNLLIDVNKLGLMLGKGFLGVITVPISLLNNLIFAGDYNGADYLITNITANQANIGEGIKFNAFSTSSYVFIRDFGYIGIIIIPIVLGIITHIITYKFNKSKNIFSYSTYILLLYIVFYSPLRYELIFPIYFIVILMLYIFTRRFNIRVCRKFQ